MKFHARIKEREQSRKKMDGMKSKVLSDEAREEPV